MAASRLTEPCIQALKKKLVDLLPSVSVGHGTYISNPEASGLPDLDSTLPRSGAAREQLKQILGDRPAWRFTVDYLSALLRAAGTTVDPVPAPRPLLEVLSRDAESLAAEVVGALNTLPWVYVFATSLPREIVSVLGAAPGRPLELAEGLVLEDEGGTLSQPWPLQPFGFSLEGVPNDIGPPVSAPALLRYTTRGYVSLRGDTRLVADARETILALVGMSIALGLVQEGFPRYGFGPPSQTVHIFHVMEGVPRLVNQRWFSTDISQFLQSLEPGFLFEDSDRVRRETREQWVEEAMAALSRSFARTEVSDRVRRGAQWYAESLARASEPALSFVQATVALEILLGEKSVSDVIGITETLANRCSYLIAESRSERDTLREQVRGIYKTRSNIVHSGHAWLTDSQQELFSSLRSLCGRVIRKEIDILSADPGRSA